MVASWMFDRCNGLVGVWMAFMRASTILLTRLCYGIRVLLALLTGCMGVIVLLAFVLLYDFCFSSGALAL